MPSRALATEGHSPRPSWENPPSRRPTSGRPSTLSRPGTTRRPRFTRCASNSGIAPSCHSPRSACSTPKSKWGSETPRKTFNSEEDRDVEAKEGHDAEGRAPAGGRGLVHQVPGPAVGACFERQDRVLHHPRFRRIRTG